MPCHHLPARWEKTFRALDFAIIPVRKLVVSEAIEVIPGEEFLWIGRSQPKKLKSILHTDFGGGLYVVYAIVILWSLHSLYIVFLDSGYKLTQSYGYENFTMADFTCFIQFILALPFLYLAPKLHPTMPSVALSLFSVNWAIWFTFGMITPRAIPMSVLVSIVTLGFCSIF